MISLPIIFFFFVYIYLKNNNNLIKKVKHPNKFNIFYKNKMIQ